MRVGITLPQFRSDPDLSLEVARRAEEVGLDGVFAFDHLWPLGRPHRPALHSYELLGALAAETSRVRVGSLVARVGVVPDAVLVAALEAVHRIAGGRFIAGLGTGDAANKDENRAYGVGFPPMPVRRARLVACARDLRARGVPAWVGGLSPAARRMAVEAGATGWNGWGLDVGSFARDAAELAGTGVEPTWAGQVLVGRSRSEADAKLAAFGARPGLVWGSVEDLRRHLDGLRAAGATWAVCAPLDVARDPSVAETLSMAIAGSG